jgi:hypothetical protein
VKEALLGSARSSGSQNEICEPSEVYRTEERNDIGRQRHSVAVGKLDQVASVVVPFEAVVGVLAWRWRVSTETPSTHKRKQLSCESYAEEIDNRLVRETIERMKDACRSGGEVLLRHVQGVTAIHVIRADSSSYVRGTATLREPSDLRPAPWITKPVTAELDAQIATRAREVEVTNPPWWVAVHALILERVPRCELNAVVRTM